MASVGQCKRIRLRLLIFWYSISDRMYAWTQCQIPTKHRFYVHSSRLVLSNHEYHKSMKEALNFPVVVFVFRLKIPTVLLFTSTSSLRERNRLCETHKNNQPTNQPIRQGYLRQTHASTPTIITGPHEELLQDDERQTFSSPLHISWRTLPWPQNDETGWTTTHQHKLP